MKRNTQWIAMVTGIVLAVLTAVPYFAQQASSQIQKDEVALRAAMEKETVQGDLKGAVEQYKKLAASKDRSIAAKALLRMAGAYQQLGDSEARKVYEQIVRDFGDQKDVAATAKLRLGGTLNSGTLTKRLLHDGCADLAGALSSDGRWLVDSEIYTGDLAICNTSTGQRERLFVKSDSEPNALYASAPAISPDLRQIVYSSGYRTKPTELRVVARVPHSKSQLVFDNSEYGWFDADDWFPDGKSVLIKGEKQGDNTWELLRIAIGSGQITPLKSLEWRLSSGSRNRRRGRARVSPDGRYIAYSALAVNPKAASVARPKNIDQHIYVLASDGSEETEVVKTAGINANPIWTPDGKHLLFTSDRSGSVGLWSVGVVNGKAMGSETLVVPEIGNIIPIDMRGNSYFYQETLGQLESIAIVEAKRGTVSRPDRAPLAETFAGFAPSWSPDGKWIAFKRRLRGSQEQNVLIVRSLETGDETTYPTSLGTTGAAPATWYHDSKSLLIGVNGDFYRLDLKTREFHPLGIRTQTHALSPDDKTLYVLDRGPAPGDSSTFVAIDLSTRERRNLLKSPAGAPTFTLSPDGRTLAVGWLQEPIGQSKLHIGRISVDRGDFRELYAGNLPQREWSRILTWSKDGKSILFSQGQPGGYDHWGIMQIPADGGASASLVLESNWLTGFDVSADGSRFVVGEQKQGVHLVALDNVLSLQK